MGVKQILLIRHAKVDADYDTTIYAKELKEWIESYDTAPICADSLPSDELRECVLESDIVITSRLNRAIESAQVLGLSVDKQEAIFNEAEIPQITIPYLKLKPKSWFVVLRVWSLLGFGDKNSSLKATKLRAEQATTRLLVLSSEYESVTLVGHGGMNWLMGKELQKRGWRLEPNASMENWGRRVWRLEE